jgi:beta-glucosidase
MSMVVMHVRRPNSDGKLTDLVAEAVNLAQSADAALVFAGLPITMQAESFDRADFSMLTDEEAVAKAVAEANPKTVLVLQIGTAVDLSRVEPKLAGILQSWYPGQRGGLAIADVILGNRDPGGRLPLTWPRQLSDLPAMAYYPGTSDEEPYGEGMALGYRGFENHGSQPLYHFGEGLSYARIKFSALSATLLKGRSERDSGYLVRFRVHNSSARRGFAVPQVYVRRGETFLGLRHFGKLSLGPGESRRVEWFIPAADLTEYQPKSKRFEFVNGNYTFELGYHAGDRPLAATVNE